MSSEYKYLKFRLRVTHFQPEPSTSHRSFSSLFFFSFPYWVVKADSDRRLVPAVNAIGPEFEEPNRLIDFKGTRES